MRRSSAATLCFLVGTAAACAVVPEGTAPAPIQVFSRSHNRSEVDVYLLCGSRNATWLGAVAERGTAGFEIPGERARCLRGLNFFLVVRKSGWGYWAGPVQPRPGGQIVLVIAKYAGLSGAHVANSP
jgi:hypothetical protein